MALVGRHDLLLVSNFANYPTISSTAEPFECVVYQLLVPEKSMPDQIYVLSSETLTVPVENARLFPPFEAGDTKFEISYTAEWQNDDGDWDDLPENLIKYYADEQVFHVLSGHEEFVGEHQVRVTARVTSVPTALVYFDWTLDVVMPEMEVFEGVTN